MPEAMETLSKQEKATLYQEQHIEISDWNLLPDMVPVAGIYFFTQGGYTRIGDQGYINTSDLSNYVKESGFDSTSFDVEECKEWYLVPGVIGAAVGAYWAIEWNLNVPYGAICSGSFGIYSEALLGPVFGEFVRNEFYLKPAAIKFNAQLLKKLEIRPIQEPLVDRQALWRSALIPGWGQFYDDRPIAGSILGLFNFAALGLCIAPSFGYPGIPAGYEGKPGEQGKAIVGWSFVGLYSLNLLDAALVGPGKEDFESRPKVQVGAKPGGLTALISWKY